MQQITTSGLLPQDRNSKMVNDIISLLKTRACCQKILNMIYNGQLSQECPNTVDLCSNIDSLFILFDSVQFV